MEYGSGDDLLVPKQNHQNPKITEFRHDDLAPKDCHLSKT